MEYENYECENRAFKVWIEGYDYPEIMGRHELHNFKQVARQQGIKYKVIE